jgi:hypothetical protein
MYCGADVPVELKTISTVGGYVRFLSWEQGKLRELRRRRVVQVVQYDTKNQF